MHVFGQARRVSADAVERGATEDAVGADRLCRPVPVHAHHDRAVKVIGLLGSAASHQTGTLIPIRLHRLHESDGRVFKIPERAVEKIRGRFVVRVEHDGNLSARPAQRVVDVARLGVLFFDARDVDDPELPADLAQLRVVSLVTQVVGMRVTDVDHRAEGSDDHLLRLAGAGGGQDVDGPVAPRGDGGWDGDVPVVVPLKHPTHCSQAQCEGQRDIRQRIPDTHGWNSQSMRAANARNAATISQRSLISSDRPGGLMRSGSAGHCIAGHDAGVLGVGRVWIRGVAMPGRTPNVRGFNSRTASQATTNAGTGASAATGGASITIQAKCSRNRSIVAALTPSSDTSVLFSATDGDSRLNPGTCVCTTPGTAERASTPPDRAGSAIVAMIFRSTASLGFASNSRTRLPSLASVAAKLVATVDRPSRTDPDVNRMTPVAAPAFLPQSVFTNSPHAS